METTSSALTLRRPAGRPSEHSRNAGLRASLRGSTPTTSNKRPVKDDVERLEKHVYPRVAHVRLAAFAREHADRVVAKLPAALKRSTRRHVTQVVNRVLRLAVFVGEIKSSPLPRLASEDAQGGRHREGIAPAERRSAAARWVQRSQ